MSKLDDLRKYIQTHYHEGDLVLGSQLGGLVKKEYGELVSSGTSLSSLIKSELSDQLVFAGKKGSDNTYRVIDSSGKSRASLYTSDTGELWNVFSNPRYPGSIFIRNADKALVKLNDVATPLSHGFTELPRLADQDVQEIINNYNKIIGDHYSANECPVMDAHYWRNWMQYLRSLSSENSSIITEWRSFHAQSIENAFAKRLDHFGFPSKEIEKWVWILTTSRTKLPDRDTKVDTTSSNIGISSEKSLRQIIHRAIDNLSDDQLKSVTLPVGALIDATRNS
jgi:hypothetical protein